MPWIELTRKDGTRVSVQSRHIVSFEPRHNSMGTDHFTEVKTIRENLQVAEEYTEVSRKLLYR